MVAASAESTSRSRRADAVLHYLRDTQRAALDHLDPPTHFDRAETMVLDGVTVRNLELTDPIFYDRGADSGATLIGVLDQTATGMGGRMLRQRLLRPSLDRNEIESRLDAVTDLAQAKRLLRAELRKQLVPVLDVERLLAKVMIGSAGPRDLLALGKSLDQTPRLAESGPACRKAALRPGWPIRSNGSIPFRRPRAPSLPRCPIRRR